MKKSAIATKLCAAACAIALVAAPVTALASPVVLGAKDAPVVAQSYDYGDSVTVAAYDAGYSLSEIAITDLDTYYDVDGVLVDYVGYNAYGTHFDYEIDHFTGAVCRWSMYAL